MFIKLSKEESILLEHVLIDYVDSLRNVKGKEASKCTAISQAKSVIDKLNK